MKIALRHFVVILLLSVNYSALAQTTVVKDAPVIILDEPFNELDEDSELSLLNHLKQLSLKGKTILLVTHNTNSFSFCDNVIYLNEKTQ